MAKSERAVFTNMCMVFDGEGRVLVQNRRDPNWSGITFPGGHVEPNESFAGSVIREVKEETGLDIEAPMLCGVKQFQTEGDERYVVLLYRTDRFSGVPRGSEEGDVFWIRREELLDHPLTPDFKEMLRVFESDDLSEFYYRKTEDKWEKEFF